jgi:hypothetical protein
LLAITAEEAKLVQNGATELTQASAIAIASISNLTAGIRPWFSVTAGFGLPKGYWPGNLGSRTLFVG